VHHPGRPLLSFSIACLVGWRKLFAVVNGSPTLAERTALLGAGPLALSLAKEISSRPELGFRLIGFVADGAKPPAVLNGLDHIGDSQEIVAVVMAEQIDRLIVTMSEQRGRLPVEQLLELKARGVLVQDGPAFYETLTGKIPLESLRLSELVFGPGFFAPGGLLLYKRISSLLISLICLGPALPLMGIIFSHEFSTSRFQPLFARALSLLVAVAGLIVLAPVMALIALAIWFDSGKPILFRQRRVGKGGKIFTLYKFRSMKAAGNGNASGNGKIQPAQEMDERFTRVGRWMRRLRVDELPQLYNILRGDMHFVGPRPFMLEEEEEFAKQIPLYKYRWAVNPGATGWAQIHRPYCATLEDNKDKLSYDLFYIKNMSVGLDLLIIFQTVKTLILGRGAR